VDPFDLAIVLVSALLHACWSVAIKTSRDSLAFNLLQAALAALVALGLLATVDLGSLSPDFWRLLAMTGVAHALYLYWLSRALSEGDISLVYPIARSTPAFLPIVAVPLLGESISLVGGLGIAVVVAGIWLVNLQPGFRWRGWSEPGLVFAFLTLATTVAYGVTDARAMILLDGAAWTSPVPRPIFFFFLLHLAAIVLLLPLVLRRAGSAARVAEVSRGEWRNVLLALAIGVAGYSLILQALRTAPASYVVAARQSSVFFVLLFGVVRLGERPSGPRLLGATLTVAGVGLIAVAP
jgi:drug/metabolite transporter (DMT)-like permease